MATTNTPEPERAAAKEVVSLAQVLLAPLDALFQAQVHAGRSFLNFLLQLSYEDKPKERERATAQAQSDTPPAAPDTIFTVDFVQEVPGAVGPDGKQGESQLQKVSIPALALVPMRPLAIEQAEVDLAMEVTEIADHQQIRSSAGAAPTPPPWWLVSNPISLKGHVANAAPGTDRTAMTEKRLIQIKVKVGPVATPAGLEKLLTTLTQSAQVHNYDKPK